MWGSPGLQAPQTSRSLLSAFLSCKAPICLASLPPMAPFCESLWPLLCLRGLPDSTVFSVWKRFCHLRVLEFRHVSPPASDCSPIKRGGWFLADGPFGLWENSSMSFSCPWGRWPVWLRHEAFAPGCSCHSPAGPKAKHIQGAGKFIFCLWGNFDTPPPLLASLYIILGTQYAKMSVLFIILRNALC